MISLANKGAANSAHHSQMDHKKEKSLSNTCAKEKDQKKQR